MLKVKPIWLLKSKVHRHPVCVCPFSNSGKKHDKAHLEGDEQVADKEKNCGEDKTHPNGKNIQGLHIIEKPKYPQSPFSKMKRKSLSPAERLAALLPEEYNTNIDNKGLDGINNLHPKDEDDSQSNEKQNNVKVRQGNDFMKQRFKARTKIQPSKRLSSMFPQDYWQSLDDSETKQIVEDLGEHVDTDSKKPLE
ncbi:uncharacterized protein LOC123541710 [Mercenaria mercenaria]|uniref:uncharacterized protein LOC123541710 n=1 Tax=Mercenaria mercenaria TaxID=6596 RepID=UPI00234F7C8D|nr:uncharacterized protein LOC123541710 [Mercenaria mercenaria]